MGMSTHVSGIRPPDERWQQMKAAYDACEAAGIPAPDSVLAFFGGMAPDPAGIVVPLDSRFDGGVEIAREWQDGRASAGYEVTIADVPDNVTVIRFYNSW